MAIKQIAATINRRCGSADLKRPGVGMIGNITNKGGKSFMHGAYRKLTVCVIGTLLVCFNAASSLAEPLDHNGFATLKFEAFFSSMIGRMGFNQNATGTGTLNDFKGDMGLPTENRTFKLEASVRPLEHHLLRLYGSVPEYYKGETTLVRQLVLRSIVFPAGTNVNSELRTGAFGFGYDLDFLIGPRWFGGLNGDLKYIDVRVRLAGLNAGEENTYTVDELVPCLGAHAQARIPTPLDNFLNGLTLGGYARMNFGITPNFLNYVDVSLGLSAFTVPAGRFALDAKVGYEHESIINNQEQVSGRLLELKRDGITFSLQTLF